MHHLTLDQLPWELLERIAYLVDDDQRGLAVVALHSTCRSIFYKLSGCKNLWKSPCFTFNKWAKEDDEGDWYQTFLRYLELWGRLQAGTMEASLQERCGIFKKNVL